MSASIILCAGKGTRMNDDSKNKVAFSVAGVPVIKRRASTELNNLVITGEFMQDETAKHPQRINEGGVKRYKVSFVMSDKVFEGEMIIAIDKNGVGTFYDIVKIKESDSSNDAPNGVVRTNALSTNSISESSENVNPETDQTTKKFALSAKNTQNGKFNVEDFLFDDDYYATYQYESRCIRL